MASVPLTADNPISQGPMQSAAQTVHIPEKGEMFSGVLILVFVMELPAGGLYVTMKTSFLNFFPIRYSAEQKAFRSPKGGKILMIYCPEIDTGSFFSRKGGRGFSPSLPTIYPGGDFSIPVNFSSSFSP